MAIEEEDFGEVTSLEAHIVRTKAQRNEMTTYEIFTQSLQLPTSGPSSIIPMFYRRADHSERR